LFDDVIAVFESAVNVPRGIVDPLLGSRGIIVTVFDKRYRTGGKAPNMIVLSNGNCKTHDCQVTG
jgi:hypothetical protein